MTGRQFELESIYYRAWELGCYRNSRLLNISKWKKEKEMHKILRPKMSGSTSKLGGGYFSSNTSLTDLCYQKSTMYLYIDELHSKWRRKQPEDCPMQLRDARPI